MNSSMGVIDARTLDQALAFEESEVALIDLARRLVREQITPLAEEIDRSERFPSEWLELLADTGILYLKVPTEFGGSGPIRTTVYMRVLEELAYGSLAAATLLANISGYAEPLAMAGTPEQQEKFFPRLVASRKLGAFGLTEPEAGSDPNSMTTTATSVDGGYLINGEKTFITGLSQADMMILFAKVSKGITAFLVDVASDGIQVGSPEALLGMHGIPNVSVTFTNVFVAEDQLLGQPGRGLRIALGSLNGGRLATAAQANGISRVAFDGAVSYGLQRRVGGSRVVDFQGIQFEIAEAAARIDAGRALVHVAALSMDAGLKSDSLCSEAKFLCSDAAMDVASRALGWYGGYGYTKSYPAERHFRDAKLLQLFAGTNHIQKTVAARALVGRTS